jgi:hypothetical protein
MWGVFADRLTVFDIDTGDHAPTLRFEAVATNGCGSQTTRPIVLTVQTCVPCPADFNQDGGVDGSDIEAFFTTWESGASEGDVNFDGGVDGGDVEYFIVRWSAGGC